MLAVQQQQKGVWSGPKAAGGITMDVEEREA